MSSQWYIDLGHQLIGHFTEEELSITICSSKSQFEGVYDRGITVILGSHNFESFVTPTLTVSVTLTFYFRCIVMKNA